MHFSPARLRSQRHHAGLSRPALAARTGLSPETILAYERGKSTPSAAALGRLAEALGCPVDAMYDGGRDARGEYWAAACAALPPLSDETCRAVGMIFRAVDAARTATTTAPDRGGPDAA